MELSVARISFSSEWMRSSGILFARVQGGERNHAASYRSLLHAMQMKNR